MVMTSQWAMHANAIEEARENGNTALVGRAVMWAISTDQPEAADLYAALTTNFERQGNCNAHACELNRAVEIILDAYIEEIQRREAA